MHVSLEVNAQTYNEDDPRLAQVFIPSNVSNIRYGNRANNDAHVRRGSWCALVVGVQIVVDCSNRLENG